MKKIANTLIECFERGNKVLIIGNGGSAAMASHMAAELMGKFKLERRPLPVLSLATDTAFLTAYPNDFPSGFESIFARQIMALGKEGDVLIALSTSGRSENVLLGIEVAKSQRMEVIDFPRKGRTDRCQEYQLTLIHRVCEVVEKHFV